jgi:hypothetical protein
MAQCVMAGVTAHAANGAVQDWACAALVTLVRKDATAENARRAGAAGADEVLAAEAVHCSGGVHHT